MILIEAGASDLQTFQRAAALCDQLKHVGLPVALNAQSVPTDAALPAKFEALPYLCDASQTTFDGLIVIGASALEDDRLNALRRITLSDNAPVVAYVQADSPHTETGAAAKLSYVTDRQPHVTLLDPEDDITAGKSVVPSFGIDTPYQDAPMLRGQPGATIFAPGLQDEGFLGALQYLTTSRSFAALCYMSGKDKTEWHRRYQPGAHVYGFSEILPATLSQMSKVVVLTGEIGNNDRALCLLNNAIVSGRAVIDATPDGSFEAQGLPVLRGPADLGYLKPYLDETILPNLDGIREVNQNSALAKRVQPTALLDLFDPDSRPATKTGRKRQLHVLPTNGIGLGHAQRMVLISEALPKKTPKPRFLAFPSCLPMINQAGFDATPLIQRSDMHADGGANDLANYSRLQSAVSNDDVLVFDGGYVFDSIYRTILDRNLSAIWIRRGLWRATQNNRIPLDREKFFARVVVPREAFDELDQHVSSGTHVTSVGPIVRMLDPKADPSDIRAKLAETLDVSFSQLVVTMLGSGAVHDLSPHVQTVCAQVEQRADCLHLMVVWPGAVLPPERYAWSRSKVVTTQRAGLLAASADVLVSAAGYNSFHEAMYNAIPTIFVPQTAQILDDQTARAEAAEERGLAAHVPASKLSQLDRELSRFLDRGKAEEVRSALKSAKLPKPGNTEAAKIIAEMMS